MRKKLLTLAFAALTVGLLGSCSKINERLDSLEKKVGSIESEEIASVEQQIAVINESISDLGKIRSDIQELKTTTSSQKDEIESLKRADEALGKDTENLKKAAEELAGKIEDLGKADETLGKRIDELKAFVGDTLSIYAKKSWVEATFATLEQHEWTCDTIAKIDARIGALDTKLATGIASLEGSLKSWVNEQLSAYYTAAQMDAKLDVLKSSIDSVGNSNKARVDSLAGELTAMKTAVDTAKANIRTEYKDAIKSAIETSEGKLTKALQNSIATVNGKITALDSRVKTLESDVLALKKDVQELKDMIQTVTIVPAYSDGSVEAKDGDLTIDCIVKPAASLSGMTIDSVKVLVTKVKKTKAVNVDTVKLESFEADASKGTLTVTADISSIAPAEGQDIAVALKLTNGISKYTTKFVGVTTFKTVLPAGALPGEFSVADG